MKYKCIKDFWMEDRLRENTPAFSAGNIYEFYHVNGLDDLRTDNNDQGRIHYMPMCDINEHFELVEEEQMTALKWEEGKTYRIKPDMVDKYTGLFEICKDIYYQLGDEPFTVQSIDREGRVIKLVEISNDILDIDYWFYADEIEYFYLVEHTEEKQEMTATKTEQEIIVEWLEKLHYVLRNDNSVSEELQLYGGGLMLSTDLCDIYGATNIFDFIDNRYKDMKSQAETKRKKELLYKRASLELQLAQINKELGE